MSLIGKLIGFGVRQVIGYDAGKTSEAIVEYVVRHFADHSQTLPNALARANDRSWQALGIALAGDGLLDRIKVYFASGDEKGIREQVSLFLQDKNMGFDGSSAEFRKKCLDELKKMKEAGLLKPAKHSLMDIAHQAANFQRYADPKGMIDGAEQMVRQIADELEPHYPNLAKLLRQQPSGSPPLLVAAFAYFFRHEVEANQELANGLMFDGLRQLSANHEKAFTEVGKALDSLGEQFEQLFEQLDRIEMAVVETHGAVLDLRVELARIGEMNLSNSDDVRRLLGEVLNRISFLGMQNGEVKPHLSFGIRNDDERIAVKHMLARFRRMPIEQQRRLPALLNGLGKLQIDSGDFDEARQTFESVSEQVVDLRAKAEAQFNAYRAALEEKNWDKALVAIQKATALDSRRFSPFPMNQYCPQRILGAGGFGTAFLCHECKFGEEVVVKTIHAADLERSTTDVFREALLLRKLNHECIIKVRDYDYADPENRARPFIVMDYFPGKSLASVVEKHGVISLDDMIAIACQIADGLNAAHQEGILHRDIKPDNVLILKETSSWKVKIIDFGLALRKQAIETSLAVRAAGKRVLSESVAGTIKYAPPEQMGEMKGVKPGPYSDVYAFGKTICYALFQTTELKKRHWSSIPNEFYEILDQCTETSLTLRWPSFEPVLKELDALQQIQAQRAEIELADLLREILDRTHGRPTKQDTESANEFLTKHRISPDRLRQLLDNVQMKWENENPPKSEPTPGEIITNSVGMQFSWVPPGKFLMGSPNDEEGRGDDETQHRVTLTNGLYLAVRPVTQAEWRQIMGYNPSELTGDDLPIDSVSWDDCQAFLRKLSQRDGHLYRLPTEAEWEYACRAGTTTPFSFGETIFDVEAILDEETKIAVRRFPANPWGLYDMHGNVWEWCADWYDEYPEGDVVDPTGPTNGIDRVLRGGSAADPPCYMRSAYRSLNKPDGKSSKFGFRPARYVQNDSPRLIDLIL